MTHSIEKINEFKIGELYQNKELILDIVYEYCLENYNSLKSYESIYLNQYDKELFLSNLLTNGVLAETKFKNHFYIGNDLVLILDNANGLPVIINTSDEVVYIFTEHFSKFIRLSNGYITGTADNIEYFLFDTLTFKKYDNLTDTSFNEKTGFIICSASDGAFFIDTNTRYESKIYDGLFELTGNGELDQQYYHIHDRGMHNVIDNNENKLFDNISGGFIYLVGDIIFVEEDKKDNTILYNIKSKKKHTILRCSDNLMIPDHILVINEYGKYGLMNNDFELVFPYQYDSIKYFCDEKYLLLNLDGQQQIYDYQKKEFYGMDYFKIYIHLRMDLRINQSNSSPKYDINYTI